MIRYCAKILSLLLELVKEKYWDDYEMYLRYPKGNLIVSNRRDGGQAYYLEIGGRRQYLSKHKDAKKIDQYLSKRLLKQRINTNCRELVSVLRPCGSFITLAIDRLKKESVRRTFEIRPSENPYYRENLKQKTSHGEYVRSKSEVIIANMLYEMGLEYRYEKELRVGETVLYPDFTVTDPYTGETVILEHLGLMSKENYRERWSRKQAKYEVLGFTVGKDLLVTDEDEAGNIDSSQVAKMLKARFSVERYSLLLQPILPVS